MTETLTAARTWLAQDPDPRTREELSALLEQVEADVPEAVADLEDRFGARLEFGTAGLRGALGAGPNRMNRVVVMRAAAGLGSWLGEGPRHVVVGHDARYRSEDFAVDTAAVLNGAGHRVSVLPGALPTPVLAFAVRELGADAGVMVTASHNPPQDNGYKVYVGGAGEDAGTQIVAPADAEISAAIDRVGAVGALPLGSEWTRLGPEILERYLAAVTALTPEGPREVGVTYTAMHGVGGRVLIAAMERAGFPRPTVVAEQFEPDPAFPTVSFPNPEEPGAMDLALREGEANGTDVIVANDPDADRLAVAVPGHGMLSGDEVGGLLAEYVLDHTSGERAVAASIVSSALVGHIAHDHGAHFDETLTGFKWLARAGGGRKRVFSYEEALGYCVGGDGGRPVADKDGIGAALVLLALAAWARRDGRTLLDLLDVQAQRYGLHLTEQLSMRVADLSLLTGIMRRLRSDPPEAFGPFAVEGVEDFAAGHAELPPTDALRFRLEGGGRVTLRPSGTEPKLKAYAEVVLDAADEMGPIRARGVRVLAEVMSSVSGLVRGR
ncbi:phospho-sugar mutase [Nocardiopsis xinjiangensis]|uniref:phospho-sugar mutase n=1 Tax=Nocardiopsis xinjiangensis TaxID=124285 RepID=UPI0003476198|nr:phospho-sugar mutase [Nocardiopsis xinjiangensis]